MISPIWEGIVRRSKTCIGHPRACRVFCHLGPGWAAFAGINPPPTAGATRLRNCRQSCTVRPSLLFHIAHPQSFPQPFPPGTMETRSAPTSGPYSWPHTGVGQGRVDRPFRVHSLSKGSLRVLYQKGSLRESLTTHARKCRDYFLRSCGPQPGREHRFQARSDPETSWTDQPLAIPRIHRLEFGRRTWERFCLSSSAKMSGHD
jgi:hypothetical protein